MIELVVAVAIVGVLLSLVLVAVSSIRRSSQLVTCSSRLHTLGLACSSYQGDHRTFPPGRSLSNLPFTAQVLPYLDSPEAERLNFEAGFVDAANLTCACRRLTCFVCPAAPDLPRIGNLIDAGSGISVPGCESSYVGSYGSGTSSVIADGVFGRYATDKCIAPANIVDGLSKTAMLSEQLKLPRDAALQSGISAMVVVSLRQGYTEDEFYAACLGGKAATVSSTCGWLMVPYYDHGLPPNSSYCVSQSGTVIDSSPASSAHVDLVNVCFSDGHCVGITSKVDRKVWRLLGGRDDGGPPQSY